MGGLRAGPQVDYFGNILADVQGSSFKVRYHGSTEGDVPWRPGPAGLQPQPGSLTPPDC